ncbi:MAG: N-acetylneuraminate synthase family protein [Candidatus Schekmanbacteria bacterium]|nr:N-acetylneuraminate synthase family protein [Candidatus Schekmanbacteria bacterium]
MLIVMQEAAAEGQIQGVIERLTRHGFDIHRSTGKSHVILGAIGDARIMEPDAIAVMPGVARVVRVTSPYHLAGRECHPEDTVVEICGVPVGGPELTLVAGPGFVEDGRQLRACAEALSAAGMRLIRADVFRSGPSPYALRGPGQAGLQMLRAAASAHGLALIAEVATPEHVEAVADVADAVEVGARAMQSFSLLETLGKSGRPVILRRHPGSTIEEWLLAAENVLAAGNEKVILCEAGVRGYGGPDRLALDISCLPAARALTHLPILVDVGPSAGRRDRVPVLARAAVAAGAQGVVLEVHPDPDRAAMDGAVSLIPAELYRLVGQLHRIAAITNESSA